MQHLYTAADLQIMSATDGELICEMVCVPRRYDISRYHSENCAVFRTLQNKQPEKHTFQKKTEIKRSMFMNNRTSLKWNEPQQWAFRMTLVVFIVPFDRA